MLLEKENAEVHQTKIRSHADGQYENVKHMMFKVSSRKQKMEHWASSPSKSYNERDGQVPTIPPSFECEMARTQIVMAQTAWVRGNPSQYPNFALLGSCQDFHLRCTSPRCLHELNPLGHEEACKYRMMIYANPRNLGRANVQIHCKVEAMLS